MHAGPGEPLAFLFPGFLHQLGNDLFAIRGYTELLASGKTEARPDHGGVLEAARRAQESIELMRLLAGEDSGHHHQAGVLLSRLCNLCRVSMRDRAIRLVPGHTSKETPRLVDGRTLVQAVATVLCELTAELPPGIEGTLELDLRHQEQAHLEVTFALAVERTFLPFPLDPRSVCERTTAALAELGAAISCEEDGRIVLSVPVAGLSGDRCSGDDSPGVRRSHVS